MTTRKLDHFEGDTDLRQVSQLGQRHRTCTPTSLEARAFSHVVNLISFKFCKWDARNSFSFVGSFFCKRQSNAGTWGVQTSDGIEPKV